MATETNETTIRIDVRDEAWVCVPKRGKWHRVTHYQAFETRYSSSDDPNDDQVYSDVAVYTDCSRQHAYHHLTSLSVQIGRAGLPPEKICPRCGRE